MSTWFFYDVRRRYAAGGLAALEAQSRAPHRVANRTPDLVEDAIVALRKELTDAGLDAGPATIRYHLEQRRGGPVPSEATIWRMLHRRGFVTPDPSKWPRPAVRDWGWPERMLWDNAKAHHALTDTLAARDRASSIAELQAQLDEFLVYYNTQRPHRSIGRKVPTHVWHATPKRREAPRHPRGMCCKTTGRSQRPQTPNAADECGQDRTRRSSSGPKMPSRTRRAPATRRVRMPFFTAIRSRSGPAVRWAIRARISSSSVITS